MKFGAANYLTKPVSMDEVVDALDVVDEEDPIKHQPEPAERVSLGARKRIH